MPIADDIRTVAERALLELDRVSDFLERSEFVWRNFEDFVAKGHRSRCASVATGNAADQDELIRLLGRYLDDYLKPFTFGRSVVIFETFLFDLLRLVLRHNPWQLAKKQLAFTVVLNAADRDAVIFAVIDRELNELKYEKLKDWFEYLNKAVRIDSPTAEEIETLAEIKATRDVLEHNAGVANDVYVNKAGRLARYCPGQHVELPDPYHRANWQAVRKVVGDVADAALARLAPPPPRPRRSRRGRSSS